MSLGLIFDLDGTLMDTVPVIEQSQTEVLQRYGVVLPPGYSNSFAGLPLRNIVALINKDFGKSLDWQEVGGQMSEIESRVLEDGPSIVFDGLVYLLKEARRRRVGLAVGTSSQIDRAHGLLYVSNLWKYFDDVVGIEAVKNGKPAPDIFLECASKLGYAPKQCVVFGDAENDLLAARAGGMKFIGFSPGVPKEALSGSDLIIASYKEVSCKVLESLLYHNGK